MVRDDKQQKRDERFFDWVYANGVSPSRSFRIVFEQEKIAIVQKGRVRIDLTTEKAFEDTYLYDYVRERFKRACSFVRSCASAASDQRSLLSEYLQ